MDKQKKVLLALFVLAFAVRLFFINDGLFHHDSLQMAKIIEQSSFSDLFSNEFFLLRIGNLIIAFFLLKFFSIFTHVSAEFIVNFSSVLFGSLCVPAIYLFTYSFFKKHRIALFSSLLFCFSPLALSVSTYGKEHMAQLFFLLTAFWLINTAKSRNMYLLSGLTMGLALFMRESSVFYIPFFFVLAYRRKQILCPAIPFFLLFLLQLKLSLFARIVHVLQANIFGSNEISVGTFIFGYKFIMHVLHNLAVALNPLAIPFIVGGIYLLFRRKDYFRWGFLLAWMSITFYFMVNTIFAPRWLVEVLPPFFIFASLGLHHLHKNRKTIANIALVILVISSFASIYPVLKFRSEYSAIKEFSLFVKENTEKDAIIIFDADNCVHLEHYSNRKCKGDNLIDKYKLLMMRDYIEDNLDKDLYIVYNEKRAKKWENHVMFFKYLGSKHNLVLKGKVEYEDFHKNSLQLELTNVTLFKIVQKPANQTKIL